MRRIATTIVALLAAILTMIDVSAQTKIRRRLSHPGTGASAGTLTLANLSNCKMWIGPAFTVGTVAIGHAVAMDHDGSTRRYFTLNGDGNIYSNLEPADASMSPCNSAFGSLTPLSNGTLTSWGVFPDVHTGDSGVGEITPQTHNGTAYAFGLSALESTTPHTLAEGFTGTYTGVPRYEGLNSFGLVTLNEGSHTLSSIYGCYGLNGIRQNYLASQIIQIPSAFVTSNGLGTKTWAFGAGFPTTSAAFYALGPHLYAVAPPASNGCPALTDNAITDFTTLSQYVGNSTGPTCRYVTSTASGPSLNCAENLRNAPANPLPARTAFLLAKSDDYSESWDSYQGVGYIPAESSWRTAWYHDSNNLAGVALLYELTHGAVNTTISAVQSDSSVTLATLDAGGGTTINPGDFGYLQMCTPGAGNCCSAFDANANGDHLEKIKVSTVNTGTKTITFTVPESCSAGCTPTTPLVSGAALFGSIYIHGAPNVWRKTFRLSIYSEQQFANVIAGSPVYSPTYNEDVGLVAQFSWNGIGDPTLGAGAAGGGGQNETKVAGIFADATAHKLVFVIKYWNGTEMRHAYFRVDVG